MLNKLQCAPRMGDSFQIVALSMSEVVHGISIPFGTCADVRNVQNAINQWVTEKHVGMSHIYFCTKHKCSRLTFAAVHEFKQAQVLLNRTVAERTVGAWAGGGSLLLGNHFSTLLVNIGTSLLDEPHGKVPQLLEIVAGIIDIRPFEAQPLDVVFYAFNVFRVFFDGVGVIETQVTDAAIFFCKTKVNSNSLSMSDVQIAIGFRGEACLQSSTVFPFSQVFFYKLFNEALAFSLFAVVFFFDSHSCIVICSLFTFY